MALRSREIRMTQTADIKPFWLEDGATLYNDLCIQRQCWHVRLGDNFGHRVQFPTPSIYLPIRQANQLD